VQQQIQQGQKVREKVIVEAQVKEPIQAVNLEALIQAVQRRVKAA
jgi:hypothetical protein